MTNEPNKYEIDEAMEVRLTNSFRYHSPFGDQGERYDRIRRYAQTFARFICHQTPPSREQSLALTALEDVVMRANQAIALHEKE